MLTLYYSPGACSLAAHIALEEAGADFDAVRVTINQGAHLRPEYLAINPRGRVPALVVGDAIVTESTALLSYIGHRFPQTGLLPLEDPLALARVYELLSYFSASVHVAFAQLWRPQRFTDDLDLHARIQDGGRRAIAEYFDEIERLVASNGWLVGDRFSVADTYPFIFYRWGRLIGLEMDRFIRWSDHTNRMARRPSVARAVAREGLALSNFAVDAAKSGFLISRREDQPPDAEGPEA